MGGMNECVLSHPSHSPSVWVCVDNRCPSRALDDMGYSNQFLEVLLLSITCCHGGI